MYDDKPEEILDFSGCENPRKEDFYTIEMKKLKKKSIQNTREKIKMLINKRKKLNKVHQGPFDDVYRSIDILDGDQVSSGISGTVTMGES